MKKANFILDSKYKPSGDQPAAIKELIEGFDSNRRSQVLMGVTGSGKTFTMANTIVECGVPTLIMAPNKILAAQLFTEMKGFFPKNHVEYFVSYYDYYQPEAYVPTTDTYIDKDASINSQLDRMRHSATRSLIEYKDVIIVSSVSALYGLGSPETYSELKVVLKAGDNIPIKQLISSLIEMQYKRNDIAFDRGNFRLRGDSLDIFPSHSEDRGWRVSFWGDEIEEISEFDILTGQKTNSLNTITIYPNSHYIMPLPSLARAMSEIKDDLSDRLDYFELEKKLLEKQRLSERTNFDVEMIQATGTCRGIENYSRYLSGRAPGEPPPTLFEYLPKDALLFVDESHISIPQIRAMYSGDRSRKKNLVEYGFRLPSCLDNRPLTFDEWDKLRPNTIFVSATPDEWELSQSNGVITEQLIRPTGLLDPLIEVHPTEHQVDDLMNEAKKVIKQGARVLCTTLTKKMSEALTEYLNEHGVKAKYMHSDIETLERIELIRELRLGKYDVLVGINLLREGLDIPECELVAIMDADKEGFLRSERSLIQTIGRAARNSKGRVILYGDKITDSMANAIKETNRRREIQSEYNKKHHITPTTIKKDIFAPVLEDSEIKTDSAKKFIFTRSGVRSIEEMNKDISKLTKQMKKFAEDLDFEKAGEIRDEIKLLKADLLSVGEV